MEIRPIDPEFVRVWSRVKGDAPASAPTPEPEPEDWEDFLTGKLRAELERQRLYRMLGLEHAARESLSRAKKLSTAWFFRSGQRCWPQTLGRTEKYPSRAEAIRQLYHAEELSERDYLAAKERCVNATLCDVFFHCAKTCRDTRQRLWNAIEHRK